MAAPTKLTVFGLPAIARLGRYEVLGRFAEGGMAEIYLGRERAPGGATRIVALKRMRPHVARDENIRERFEREGRLSMELRHPNICAVFEYGTDGGAPYLAMEWIRGVSLRELIAKAGPTLPFEVVLRIVIDVAAALHAAHSARTNDGTALSIVHRDVTPENVLLGFDGTVRLVDFGIAKAAIQRGRTEAGILKGKIEYMAPEQFGTAEIDGRADVFSLGLCLYETLVGQTLYERESHAQTMTAILLGEPPPFIATARVDAPDAIDAVFRKAIARDVRDRYQTADDFARDLERIAQDSRLLLRSTDLARLLDEKFPGVRDAAPALDRSPLPGTEPTETKAEADLNLPSIEAELDALSETVERSAKRKRTFVLVAGVVLVLGAVLAVLSALMPGGAAP